jgi:hypothetical protein
MCQDSQNGFRDNSMYQTPTRTRSEKITTELASSRLRVVVYVRVRGFYIQVVKAVNILL